MTTITTAPETSSTSTRLVTAASATYLGAWLIGLGINSSGPAIDAPGAEIVEHYAESGGLAAVQSLLVHGVAGVALAVVAAGLARHRPARHRRPILVTGLSAAVVSVVQLMVVLAASVDSVAAPELFDALNRVDGVKLLALAGFAAATARAGLRPRWLAVVASLLFLSLLPAAAGYLALHPGLAAAAAPGLLLLLVFVPGAGLTLGRSARSDDWRVAMAPNR